MSDTRPRPGQPLRSTPLPPRDQWSFALIADTKGGHPTLDALADRLRLPLHKATWASLLVNRVPVSLSLDIDSGVVTGVKIVADVETTPGAPPGPYLHLREETAQDKRDKASRTSVEVQVGTRPFDDRVYIDSNATEAEVRRVLGRPETRAAVQRLLALGLAQVELDARHVSVKLEKGSHGWAPHHFLEIFEQLLVIVRGGGVRGAVQPRNGEGLLAGAAIAFAVSILVALVSTMGWGAGFLVGALAWVAGGAFTWPLVKPFVRPVVAGDSGSGRRLRTVVALLSLAGADLGLSAVLGVNALGREVERVRGHVAQVGSYDSEDRTWSVTVRWDDGRSDRVGARFPPNEGDAALRTERAGLFARWDKHVELRPLD